MIPIGPLLPSKEVRGKRVKRDPYWWLSVRATCCETGERQLIRNKRDWSLDCDGCGGFDDLQYCPWCGTKLATFQELGEEFQK